MSISEGDERWHNLQCIFTLTLGTVRVNGSTWKLHVEKVVVKEIGSLLVVDEDDCTRRWHREQKVEKALALFGLIDEYNLSAISDFVRNI